MAARRSASDVTFLRFIGPPPPILNSLLFCRCRTYIAILAKSRLGRAQASTRQTHRRESSDVTRRRPEWIQTSEYSIGRTSERCVTCSRYRTGEPVGGKNKALALSEVDVAITDAGLSVGAAGVSAR